MFGKFGGMMEQMKLLQKLMQDENFRKFMSHPKVQELFKEPEFQEIMKTKDFAKMSAYPKFAELMKDPELAALLQKIKPNFTA